MFLRRQDVLDRFASNFRETEDGQVLFQPRRAKIGLPITSEEYDAVTAAFERRRMIDMAMSWVAIVGGGSFGLYRLLADNSYLAFFGAFGLGCIVAFMISLRGHLDVLEPLGHRLQELVKASKSERPSVDHSALGRQ